MVLAERLVHGGAALVRSESGVIFVEGALPGERIRIGPVYRAGGTPRADLLEILEPSPHRRVPVCPLFGECGGCDWQHLEYSQQLRWKREILAENFRRLGSLSISPERIDAVAGAEYGYRNRVQVHPAASGGVGFRRRQSHETLAVAHCPVATPAINAELARLNVGDQANDDGLRPARTVLVEDEHGVAQGGVQREAVISIDGAPLHFDPSGFAQSNHALLPELAQRVRKAYTGGVLVDLYAGAGLLTAMIATGGRQSHPEKDAAVIGAGEPQSHAGKEPTMICVEPDRRNARFIADNLAAQGYAGTVEVIATTAERAIRRPPLDRVPPDTTVLVDPPRGGLSKAVTRWLVGAEAAPRAGDAAATNQAGVTRPAGAAATNQAGVTRPAGAAVTNRAGVTRPARAAATNQSGVTRPAGAAAARVIYVSCDAAALARDVGRLRHAYHVTHVTLLDFYPQTAHIEALVILDRRIPTP